jgi:hypothetical protein
VIVKVITTYILNLKDKVTEAVSSKDRFCGSVSQWLQGNTPCPKGEVLHW